MKLLSIVIPVYNVEKYLEECLDSIIKQVQDEDLEILVVDDGSTDKCTQIVDDYEKKYDFILAFHKINGGLSDARNYGIMHSNGQYLLFLDSDDMIKSDCISSIINILKQKKPDIIIGNLNYLYNDGTVSEGHSHIARHVSMDKDTIIKYLLTVNNFTMEACKLIIKKELLEKNNLYFIKGILHEDEDFTPKIICCAETIYLYDDAFYLYRQRNSSITTTIKVKRSMDKFDTSKRLYIESQKKCYTQSQVYFLRYRSIMILTSSFGEYNQYSKFDKKKLDDKFTDYNMILNSINDNKKIKIARILIKTLGIRNFSRIQIIRGKVGKNV